MFYLNHIMTIKKVVIIVWSFYDNNLFSKRPEIISNLREKGIGSSVYYPQPVPRMKYYRNKYGYNESQYPIASQISDGIIAFPVGPHLNIKDMEIIASELKKYMDSM